MKDSITTVLYNRQMAPGYYCMGIAAPGYPQLARPGQFVMVRVNQSYDPLLRRPFGIFRTGTEELSHSEMESQDYMEVVYKVVGRGTRLMSHLVAGDEVGLLGPLGQGFCISPDAGGAMRDAVLVGGGIGVVPLFMLAQQLVARGVKVHLLLGGRNCGDILALAEFERLGVKTSIATDDGTLGEKCFVTQLLQATLQKFPAVQVFACGPTPMLHAVQQICAAAGAELQVSLEATMACGVGACLGCVVEGRNHSEQQPEYLCTCKQGPVFDAHELAWTQEALGPVLTPAEDSL
ncbi:MAG: dihydroorotate dehydrogenase electron transfer subunit [Desulfuromonadaceae bacterium]|nr:dihydroorotate dehydrogenase electron transfer subunit [Desulfuromonas sp.]MDY0185205.1 dihydroorotate dehydrogenase electron transfer subunit [Desulfuromonadaceae bacterium]